MLQESVELIIEIPQVRSARAGARWITALDHEVGVDAMEDDAIVEPFVGQGANAVRCARSSFAIDFFKELESNLARKRSRDSIGRRIGRLNIQTPAIACFELCRQQRRVT